MKTSRASLMGLLLALPLPALPGPLLKLPDFDRLTDKAAESVTITLDPALVGLATRFLDSGNPEDAAVKDVIRGITGIYVRSFKFDRDFEYPVSDIEAVRKQLAAPGWQRLMQARSRREQTKVDVYLSVDGGKANGLALIASEPREFTIVNIVGSVDLAKLHKLEGQFGIPRLDIEEKPVAPASPVAK